MTSMQDQASESGRARAPVPLFVFGVARSGTSYMQELLNSHPGIRMTFEGRVVREGEYLYRRHRNLHDRAEFDKLLDAFRRAEADEPLNRWLIDVMREHADEIYRRHTANPSCSGLIQDLYMYPEPVPCWGNKILRVEECPEVLGRWPTGKAVILIRDPRAVYSSMARLYEARIKYSTIYWNLHARWTRLNAVDAERYLVIKYEDFVHDALAWLEKICRLAGVWEPGVVEQLRAAHPPRKGSLDKWRSALGPQEIRIVESYCFEEMKRWGYEPEIADCPKRMGVISKGLATIRENLRWVPMDPRWWFRKRIFSRFFRTLRR